MGPPRSLISELTSFARFLGGLPGLLRCSITADGARSVVARRLEDRAENFLASLERGIFRREQGPYAWLLEQAGCEPGDVRRLVRRDGVESALAALRDAGVYVGFEEFKGRRPMVRNGRVYEPAPGDFDNPAFRRYFPASTGGSSGRPRRVLMDLQFLRSRIPSQLLMLEAHGLRRVPFAQWAEIPPGHGLEAVLLDTAAGVRVDRWFASVPDSGGGLDLRFRTATRAAVELARLRGAPVPRPEYVPLHRGDVLARWAERALEQRGRCAIRAHVSKALRVALAAEERDIDLTGLTFSSGGEPATAGKVEAIRRTGARIVPNYFFMEAGPVGFGCATSDDPGDQHFMADHLALVTASRRVAEGGAVGAFHVTTLLPTAPKLLLNLETDDYGQVETRECGCLLGELGLTTHLRGIRSFSKLTGEGVTLVGSDMERILERELPSRFGGSPLDYQLVEEEDERGLTRLVLRVHPRVPLADEADVVECVLEALRRSGGGAEHGAALWRASRALRVRRAPPEPGPRGKHRLIRPAGTAEGPVPPEGGP